MPVGRDAGRWRARIALGVLWALAFWFSLGLDLTDDQFGRISPGRQILVFGDLPFRDFLDPGYFLAEFSSAAVQWLFGQNLLGELLLNALFIATGTLLVCALIRRRTGRPGLALVIAALALLSLPRTYDYDKVFFYPLGILLAWRWFEQPRPSRLLTLAIGLVAASLYRYDNGIFLGIPIVAGVAVLSWPDPRRSIALAGSLVLATGALSTPVLIFLQTHGGIGAAFDQALTYGNRERERRRITSAPRIHRGERFFAVEPSPRSENIVGIRWAPSVTNDQRAQLVTRLKLQEVLRRNTPDGRTFLYRFPDPSVGNIKQVVNDPMVEDTDGIERSTLVLLHPESRWLKVERLSPLLRARLFPDAWTPDNGQALLFYELLLLPLAATILLATRRPDDVMERAQLVVVIVLCVLLDAFILREPVNARVGGMAGPFAVLVAWMWFRIVQPTFRPASRFVAAGAVVFGLVMLCSVALSVGWSRNLLQPLTQPGGITYRLSRFAQTPPDLEMLPSSRIVGMIRYLRECTATTDAVFVSWFKPDLFYFAQRGFGGGMSATFGEHGSEPRFQQRSLAALRSHPTPVVILRNASYDEFRTRYKMLDAYFAARYRLAALIGFGDPEAGPEGYRVLVQADRNAASVDHATGLPCFTH